MFTYSKPDKMIKYDTGTCRFLVLPGVAAIYNKFEDIFGIMNTWLSKYPDLKETYERFIDIVCAQPTDRKRVKVFEKNYKPLLEIIDRVYTLEDINSRVMFSKNDKNYKLHLDQDQTNSIMQSSLRFRFFVPFLENEVGLPREECSDIFKDIASPMIDSGALDIIQKILSSCIKASSPKSNSKQLWTVLNQSNGYDPEGFELEVFNSLFFKGLPSLKLDCNPVPYLISIPRGELQWLLNTKVSTVYKPTTYDLPCLKTGVNVMETEIYYKAILSKYLEQIKGRYSKYENLYDKSVSVITSNIAKPLLKVLFGSTISHLYLSKLQLFNFMAHSILTRVESDLVIINELLLCYSTPIIERKYASRLPNELTAYIRDASQHHGLNKLLQNYKASVINKALANSILYLYKNAYYSGISGTPYVFDWEHFIDEYVQFIKNINSQEYDTSFAEIKKDIYDLGK